jgi:hypothetical protein
MDAFYGSLHSDGNSIVNKGSLYNTLYIVGGCRLVD